MNRKIKFRVWDEQRCKWLKEQESNDSDILTIGLDGTLRSQYYSSYTSCKSEDYTIQQFTGLLDKNGCEIYDGDIVSYEPRKEDYSMYKGQKDCLISWIDDEHFYGWIISSKQGGFSWGLRRSFCEKSLRVIGNIFEPPIL